MDRFIANTKDHFDKVAITNELEEISDPDERAAVLADVAKANGESVQTTIARNTSKDDHFRVATDQLLSSERTVALRRSGPRAARRTARRSDGVGYATIAGLPARSEPAKSGSALEGRLRHCSASSTTLATRATTRARTCRGYPTSVPRDLPGGTGVGSWSASTTRWAVTTRRKHSPTWTCRRSGTREAGRGGPAVNSFTGRFFHDNDRAHEGNPSTSLTPAEITALKNNPEYDDIIERVDNTSRAGPWTRRSWIRTSPAITDRGERRARARPTGPLRQHQHINNKDDCDELDEKALMPDKLPDLERARAVAAYDVMVGSKGLRV